MGQKLFSKCYSEFLTDVIRLEFGKLFNWIQIIVQFKLQCRCFPVNFATFLRTPYLQTLRKKFPNTEFFLVRIFLYSDWIRTRKAPNLDTFTQWEHLRTTASGYFHSLDCFCHLVSQFFWTCFITDFDQLY